MGSKKNNRMGAALSLLLILVIGAVAALVYTGQINLNPNSVWAVSNINLEQRGVQSGNGVLDGGDWRVIGTTDSADIQFLTLNQTTMKNLPGAAQGFPPDVAVQGSVTFGIVQNFNPYWHIPFTKIEDITVYPQTDGTYKLNPDPAHFVPPLTVSLWRTDLANKELIIPFSVGILKTGGSKLGTLVTDYPGATLVHGATGDYYNFALSFRSIAQGQLSSVINWYNPQDPTQKVQMKLLFTVGGSEYDWTQDWIVVTEKDGGQIFPNNVFPYSSLNQIEQELNPAFASPTNFRSYWFGGGNWLSHGHTDFGGPIAGTPSRLMVQADGSVTPAYVLITPPYGSHAYIDDEGYSYPTSNTNQDFDFPGWYVPSPQNQEGVTGQNVPSDWWNYRMPAAANVINDKNNLQPNGISIVNFLAQQTISGVNKPAVPPQNPNLWGYGGSGTVGNNAPGLGVAIPKAARSWTFQLDVSTDLVDTVVVTQNYVHVQITNFQCDRTTISPGDSAIVTVTLKNTNNFAGTVSQGFNMPSNIAGACAISGGDGLLPFSAAGQSGDTQTVTLYIKNTGNIVQDTPVTFTYTVINSNGDTTDSKQLQLTFKAGLGVPDTMLTINCLVQDTNEPVDGLKVTVYYGQTGTLSQTLDTDGGVARFDLQKETGACTLKITDPAGRYRDVSDFFNVAPGENSKTYHFSTGPAPPSPKAPWWQTYWLYIVAAIVAAIAVVAVAAVAKKRKRR